MALYFITYDLRKKKDYQALYDEFERFNATRVLASTWCLRHSNTTAAQLRDHFGNFVDSDDGILVDESKSWATVKVEGTPKDA
jgi:hypothetical protein